MQKMTGNLGRLIGLALVLGGLSACGGVTPDENTAYPEDPKHVRFRRSGSLMGEEGFSLFGGDSNAEQAAGSGGIPVNSFLWRGALDSISFMPLLSTDPFGGVIVTDWYQPDAKAEERIKLSVLILTPTLRADGVRVTSFRQVRDGQGNWADQPANPQVARDVENIILTRARELRVAAGK
jgi:hypothetical protein